MFGLKIFVRFQTFQRVPPVLPRNFCHPDWQGPWKRMFSFGHYPNPPPFFLAMSRDPSHWVLCNVHFTMFPPWIGLYFVCFFYWECLVHLCLPVLVYILYFYWECIVHLCPPVLVEFFLYFYWEYIVHFVGLLVIGPCSTHCTSLTNFSPLSCHSDDQKSGTCRNPFYFRIYCLQQSRLIRFWSSWCPTQGVTNILIF